MSRTVVHPFCLCNNELMYALRRMKGTRLEELHLWNDGNGNWQFIPTHRVAVLNGVGPTNVDRFFGLPGAAFRWFVKGCFRGETAVTARWWGHHGVKRLWDYRTAA